MSNSKKEEEMSVIFEFFGACVIGMIGIMISIILIMCTLSYISSMTYRRVNKSRGNKLRKLT